MKIFNSKLIILTILAMLAGAPTFAQQTTGSIFTDEAASIVALGFIIFIFMVVLVLLFKVYQVLFVMIREEEEKKAAAEGREYKPVGIWENLFARWSNLRPIEEESSIDLGHEYDGIRELDNHLPPWWLAIMYGSIVMAVVYMFGYHVADWWPLQDEEYAIQEARAAKAIQTSGGDTGAIDETTVAYNDNPTFLADGKKAYEQVCSACHRPDGGGMVGPNLTDDYWLHGGDIKDIFSVINNGVPNTAMTSWARALTPLQISQVSSYIISIGGSNPPNPKAPEGTQTGQSGNEVEETPNDTSQAADSTVQVAGDSITLEGDTTAVGTEGQN